MSRLLQWRRIRIASWVSCIHSVAPVTAAEEGRPYNNLVPKYASFDEFYAALNPHQEQAVRRFVDHVVHAAPDLELVLAWNQPMFKLGTRYVLGFMPTAKHINLLTIADDAITHFAGRLTGFTHGTRSIALPFDWDIDTALVSDIIEFQRQHAQVS